MKFYKVCILASILFWMPITLAVAQFCPSFVYIDNSGTLPCAGNPGPYIYNSNAGAWKMDFNEWQINGVSVKWGRNAQEDTIRIQGVYIHVKAFGVSSEKIQISLLNPEANTNTWSFTFGINCRV
jgi:hypothetical protein